jgi:predicted 3-demethylubiquinone-9 3-methyltransferase (glyoxalase superfamily)
MPKLTTFLMFQDGRAEEALTFYTSLFDDAKIVNITRYGSEGPGEEGKVVHASFTLAGHPLMAIDSHVKHGFGFTPSMSLHVACETEAQIDTLFAALSDGGSVMMPLGDYGFSKKYAWLADRFGVSWQLTFGG